MEFKLCCKRCGGHEFDRKDLPLIKTNNSNYYVGGGSGQVICKKCGLEDNIKNLPIEII